MSRDEVRLSLPREREFFSVAHLVLGGLAVRLNLTYDELQDLEVALDGLLERGGEGEGEITVAVEVEEGVMKTRVGPFTGEALVQELGQGPGEGFGLRRILDAVADRVELAGEENSYWVEVTKAVRGARDAAT